jgi:hypothetical protein
VAEVKPYTNQKSSGRCWIFAALNVIREKLIRDKNLESAELSQSYVFFWDKFEKAGWFLEQMIDCLDQKVEDRVISYLMKAPVNDGGVTLHNIPDPEPFFCFLIFLSTPVITLLTASDKIKLTINVYIQVSTTCS